MRKLVKRLLAICLAVLLAACIAYCGLAVYYRDEFALNTWINGVYCTGRSVADVAAELEAQISLPDNITVHGYEGTKPDVTENSWTLSLKDADLAADFTESLNVYLARQNPWLWAEHLFRYREDTLYPTLSFDEENLRVQWAEIASKLRGDADYRIEYSGDAGYALYDGLSCNLDEEKSFQLLLDTIAAGMNSVDLIDGGCYYDCERTEEQNALGVLWGKIEKFQNGGPVYDLGDGEERLSEAVMAGFLEKDKRAPFLPLLDDRGNLQVSEAAVDSFVEALAAQCDTQGKEWDFQSTRGDIVKVKGVTYGTAINPETEAEWLGTYLQELSLGKTIEDDAPHIPEYTKQVYNRSCTTIGDTYVEVDMGIQKLYYYEDGKMLLETDIVTGNARRGMSTPEGVNYVYAKQRNRILRGPDYASPVSYWMPVKGAIGIHDANWRGVFGGEIYKTGGSHGCINVPSKVMPELYELVEIGTPVVMFYGES